MVELLLEKRLFAHNSQNPFNAEAKIFTVDSILALHSEDYDNNALNYVKASHLLQAGQEEKSIAALTQLLKNVDGTNTKLIKLITSNLALSYLRLGERSNCIAGHAAESCILPIKGLGIHTKPIASQKAKELYLSILNNDPNDLESRWLLNIACMTLGEYPKEVPAKWLLPGLDGDADSVRVLAFEDVASDLKLDVNNMGGGSIAEDFDNDGYIDLMISSIGLADKMHYFKNNGDGTFTDLTDKIGLTGINGGLNMIQADYNNDGFKDIFVLRGAWKRRFGKEPNSLLKNNGDGTFTDVTVNSGLLSFHPTQAGTWNDFNNDGWVDLFIGNETVMNAPGSNAVQEIHPCELFINNQDGTFTDISQKAQVDIVGFIKGVTSGDYNNDGLKDIFISSMNEGRMLLKNKGGKGKEITFENVTAEAGLDLDKGKTFPTWFWDYNNDGWLDIFVCDYTSENSLAYYFAAENLGIPAGNPDKTFLYRNNQDGTFTNVAKEAGLNKNIFAMGSNFGDIDNDGYLDMYLGTGNPAYESIIPNKMFKNIDGKRFADVTTSARVGHLQKGHGVSFADFDNDGDQDINIEMGGAYDGDSYQNSFFLNPGQNNNHWISIDLEGSKSNRAAIGSRVKVTFRENGVSRSVYRDVNSGGSFGCSPFRREIGIGKANIIDELEIKWHGSGTVQVFQNIKPDQFIKIFEGNDVIKFVELKKINWLLPNRLCIPVLAGGR
ncbi:MAG: CRTAC1 family protein [Cyclobacteriaceae bacterium]|nr:CRTAC1 family protein [Cyclobacteriaceae bacterium]